jgi:hypothetical protein
VGRGAVASVCVLLYTPPLSPTGKDRLRAMAETTDGFEIARRDLDIRGPGEFMGARQSGDALLRFADLAEDAPLLQKAARAAAERLLRAAPGGRPGAHVARWLAPRRVPEGLMLTMVALSRPARWATSFSGYSRAPSTAGCGAAGAGGITTVVRPPSVAGSGYG